MRWFQHLEAATHQLQSPRDVVPLLSPRSEATALKENLRQMELSQQAESARADSAEKAMKGEMEQRQKLEKAVLDEQSKLQLAEAQIQDLQKKFSLESLQAKAMLEEQEKRNQAHLQSHFGKALVVTCHSKLLYFE
eukprot:symbB.v1.2.006904.t1/scaffold418.1/size208590/8